jgi:hypothetical protein
VCRSELEEHTTVAVMSFSRGRVAEKVRMHDHGDYNCVLDITCRSFTCRT